MSTVVKRVQSFSSEPDDDNDTTTTVSVTLREVRV